MSRFVLSLTPRGALLAASGIAAAILYSSCGPKGEVHIVVNPAKTFQTWRYNMMELAATPAWGTMEPALNPAWENGLKKKLISQLVDELGINTVQLTEPSGDIEMDRDCWSETNLRTHNVPGWYACRYSPVSAGPDPAKYYCADASLAHCPNWPMASLDYQYEKYLLGATGMAALLRNRGERLHVVLQYIHWPKAPGYLDRDPAFVGRQIAAVFMHIRAKFGPENVPEAVDLMVEPDNHCATDGPRRGPLAACDGSGGFWSYTALARAASAISQHLGAAGFAGIQLWGPSTLSSERALAWFNGIENAGGPALSALTTHWYDAWSSSGEPWAGIGQTAKARGICPVMDEYTDMGAADLYRLIAQYGVCGAEKYSPAVIGTADVGSVYLNITSVAPYAAHYAGPHTDSRSPAWFFPQFMHYIRDGDVREDASSDSSDFPPLAFRSPAGIDKVIIRVTATGDHLVTVAGVVPGRYRCTYTYNNEILLRLCGADQTVHNGEALTAFLPSIPRSQKGSTTAVITFEGIKNL